MTITTNNNNEELFKKYFDSNVKKVAQSNEKLKFHSASRLIEGHSFGSAKYGISLEIAHKYGFWVAKSKNEETLSIANFYDNTGEIIRQRVISAKGVSLKGWKNTENNNFFGRYLFKPKQSVIYICKNEFDTLILASLLNGKPVVGFFDDPDVITQICKKEFEYLNSFSKIVLCFGDDPKWQEAKAALSNIFSPNKLLIAHLQGFKSLATAVEAGATRSIVESVEQAQSYKASGIFTFEDYLTSIVEGTAERPIHLPFPGLQDAIKGLPEYGLTVITGGTSVGKTTFCLDLGCHFMKENPDLTKVSFMLMENTPEEVADGLLCRWFKKDLRGEFNKKVHGIDKIKATIKTLSQRSVVYDTTDEDLNMDSFIAKIEYQIKSLNCNVFFIDNLTTIVNDLGNEKDKLTAIDNICRKLFLLAKTHKVNIFLVAHLTKYQGSVKGFEEGQDVTMNSLWGSSGIAKNMSLGIGLIRDTTSEEILKYADGKEYPVPVSEMTVVKIMKTRIKGQGVRLGKVDVLAYNREIDCYYSISKDVEWTQNGIKLRNPDRNINESLGDALYNYELQNNNTRGDLNDLF